jgi:hypothetical protein
MYNGTMKNKMSRWRLATFIFVFLFAVVILFYDAFRYHLPLGYAGLYTLMAETIAENHFFLPFEIPYYGPGGIPGAYPPLGMYLMAVFLKMGILWNEYLRFAPPFLSLMAVILFYFLAEEITGSFLSAGLASIFLVCSPEIFKAHVWAAGSVRALAFCFVLLSLHQFVKAVKQNRIVYAVTAGILLGFTFLTHLYYFIFWGIFALSWVVVNRRSWRIFFTALGISLAVISPWVWIILSRHGFSVLQGAFASHGNQGFLNALVSFQSMFAWLGGNLFPYILDPFFVFCVVCGGYVLAFNRRYELLLTMLGVLLVFSPEGARFVITLGSILAGISIDIITLPVFAAKKMRRMVLADLLAVSFILSSVLGVRAIMGMKPAINRDTFSLADFIIENTPADARYLLIAGHDEAEWFPYLLRREPMISHWGSEWLGTYDEQVDLFKRVLHCQAKQSADCVENLIDDIGEPDFLITKKEDALLNDRLGVKYELGVEKEFEEYLVWYRK